MVTREERLSAAFVELTDTLVSDYDITDLLYNLVAHSVDLIGADESGLLLSDQRGSLHVMASSNERTRLLELFQLQADEGPCLDCYRSGEPVNIRDLGAERERWPRFAAAALDAGYVSVHAVPLRLRDEVLGALNLFGRQHDTLSPARLHIGRALADVATIAILNERAAERRELVIEQLEGALSSRVILEQAKGMLAAGAGVEVDEAFEHLRAYARRTQTKLSAVARELVEGKLAPQLVLGNVSTLPASDR